jgi:MOSC domain-containing protein YiiM
VNHATREELAVGLEYIRRSPRDAGVVELIVRRPARGEREVVANARLDTDLGLVGDRWATDVGNGGARPHVQLSVMNARVIALVARERARWSLSGDQLFVDLDLSVANLPAGTRLAVGEAIIELTSVPHATCKAFATRYGAAAAAFVHSPFGAVLRLRGVSARVVQSGAIRTGDSIGKLL